MFLVERVLGIQEAAPEISGATTHVLEELPNSPTILTTPDGPWANLKFLKLECLVQCVAPIHINSVCIVAEAKIYMYGNPPTAVRLGGLTLFANNFKPLSG